MGTSQNTNPITSASASLAGEQRARGYLADGRFRKARDEIKPLVKLDRAKYLPLLIDANKGLAREMISKGQVSEAQQVIAYLKTIASAAEVQLLELEICAKSGQATPGQFKALPLLTDPTVSLSEPERRRLADHLVMTFLPVPAEGPGSAQIAMEVEAVQAALQAVCDQQFERAQELLRPLRHNSVLSHWKVFIKGQMAFYSGEKEKAARLFASLPEHSAPAKASRAYLLLAGHAQGSGPKLAPSGLTLENASRLAGLAGLGQVVARADQLWAGKHYSRSYELVRETLKDFPSANPDMIGALSDFYLKAVFRLPREEVDGYAAFLENLLFTEVSPRATERALVARMLALLNERELPLSGVQDYWENFLKVHQQLRGHNAILASRVYQRIGVMAAAPRFHSSFGAEGLPALRDSDRASAALEKSIELDPTNLDSQLTLCRVYEIAHKSKERNRLLDSMTERFPENKAVLVQAARGCLDRQAFTKGLEYLQTALRVDRLDPAIPDLVVLAHVKIAQQDYARKRLPKAREHFAAVAEYRVDAPGNFRRTRWCLLAQEGLLEYLHGERQLGNQLLAQSRAASPAPVPFLFFARFAYFDLAPADAASFPFADELQSALEEANVVHAALLMQIYHYWQGVTDPMGLRAAETFLRKYLAKAIKRPFTLPQARHLAEQFRPDTVLREEYSRVIKAGLKLDKSDPFFRFFSIATRQAPRMSFFGRGRPDLSPQLKTIIEDASHLGDERTAQMARQFLDQLNLPPPVPASEAAPEWDEEEDDVEHSWSEDAIPNFADMPESEIRKMRNSLPKFIPREIIDEMIEELRRGKGPPPRPRSESQPPKISKPEPPKPDPNQLEFF